jgi:ribulose-5-phosphate 4-epimerase/fuculose-1-phosphate aldolase
MSEAKRREQMAELGRALYQRGLAPGSSGNLSVRLDDGWLLTPTNGCLGRIDPASITKLDWSGARLSGDQPSKEAFLHLAVYEERPSARAVVHLHSCHAVALSCLADADPEDVLPPITAYYVMRIGRLPLVPYYRPGDRALAEAVRPLMRRTHAVLLANHGSVIAGTSLETAVYAAEELEETARLYFILRGCGVRNLSEPQVAELRAQSSIS